MVEAIVATGTGARITKQTGFLTSEPSTFTDGKDIPFIDFTLSAEFDFLDVRHSQSRAPFDVAGGNLGQKNVSGDLSCFVDNDRIGYFLHALMGNVTKQADTPTTGVDTHTFDAGDTVPLFAMIGKYGTDTNWKKGWNLAFDSASFDFTSEMLEVSFGMAGADHDNETTDVGSPTFDFPAQNWFHFKQAGVTITPDGGSAVTANIRSGTIDYSNGIITDDFTLGSQTLNSVATGELSVEGSVELVFESGTTLADWFSGDKTATIEFLYTRDTNETLKFTVYNAYATNDDVPMANTELIVRTISFTATDDGTNDPLEVEIVNSANADYTSYGTLS